MDRTLIVIRIIFMLLCILGSWSIAYVVEGWEHQQMRAIFIGAMLGSLTILVDVLLKGFTLRGLSALTFGLFVGWLAAQFVSTSPIFEHADQENLYLARLGLYLVGMYLGAVLALRGKDDFNLVIPYIRFVPHGVEVPVAVVDTSALIDGRILAIVETKFFGHALVIPTFVLEELQHVADSEDPQRQMKGRKGLDVINHLRTIKHLDLRIHESNPTRSNKVDAKLIYLAQSMKAKILTTDYNLAQMAEFHGIEWLNINGLAKALNRELIVGDTIEIDLVKKGKEPGQAVGFMRDGSMVVVNDGDGKIGSRVEVEVQSILPSAGGRMVFGRLAA